MKTNLCKTVLSVMAIGLVACLGSQASATIVSFGFSGTVNRFVNPSNALPASIKVGVPFTGILTYDTDNTAFGKDTDPNPALGDYYFKSTGSFWMEVTVAGHTFATAAFSQGDPTASIIVHNFTGTDDTFAVDASAPTIRLDGQALPGVFTTRGFSLYFLDNTGTAYTNDVLPTVPPDLAAFEANHRFEVIAYTSEALTYDLTGMITNITAKPQPTLTIRKSDSGQLVVSWPIAATGFALESNTNLLEASWAPVAAPVIDVGVEHTVTLPSLSGTCSFRLKQ